MKIRQKTLVIRNIKQIITIVVVSVLTIVQWPSSYDLDMQLTTAQWPQAMTSTWLSFWYSWWTPTADSEHLARLPAHSFASNTLHSTQKKQSPSLSSFNLHLSCTAKECLFHSLTEWHCCDNYHHHHHHHHRRHRSEMAEMITCFLPKWVTSGGVSKLYTLGQVRDC